MGQVYAMARVFEPYLNKCNRLCYHGEARQETNAKAVDKQVLWNKEIYPRGR